MSDQDGRQAPVMQRPSTEDAKAWEAYWQAQGQRWRTMPEIDAQRQKELDDCRKIAPDIKQGIYPFKGEKLSRADVEWLLATHESSGIRGAVDWNDENQRKREGLDLRGANLRQANVSSLPLARMRGGLTYTEWVVMTEEQRSAAAVQLQGADLRDAQLQGASLAWAQLQGASLAWAQLQEADLWDAQLQEVSLEYAQLQGTTLRYAQLQRVDLRSAQLQRVDLMRAQLQGADLRRTDLEHLKLDQVIFSDQTYGSARFADINWGNVNLAVVDWGHVRELGDEQVAHQKKDSDGKTKDKQTRVKEYKEAVRANRQLAVVLRDQGLNEEADHFAYRAQLLQRVVWKQQRRILKYMLSWFLYLIAGYGYRPIRSVIWYLVVILSFAIAYSALGHLPPVPDALIFSLTSFHGRGFFPGLGNETSLHNPLVVFAALEAVVGLFIEISFIATFTQRFFGK